YDPGAFDAEPLRPYNVGPDALAVNFKTVRFVFAPNVARDTVEVRVEPPLDNIAIRETPTLAPGDCGDWHSGVQAHFSDRAEGAAAFSIAGAQRLASAGNDRACRQRRPAMARPAQAQVPRAGHGKRLGSVTT